jgi:hypothetical protein
MGLLKRTYALPGEMLESFERTVPKGKRSVLLATLIREWLHAREREKLREAIVRGCQEMGAEYLSQEREYHPLEEEVDRGT